MTDHPDGIAALIQRWRESAEWESSDGSPEFGKGRDQCADELAALVAARGPQPDPGALVPALLAVLDDLLSGELGPNVSHKVLTKMKAALLDAAEAPSDARGPQP